MLKWGDIDEELDNVEDNIERHTCRVHDVNMYENELVEENDTDELCTCEKPKKNYVPKIIQAVTNEHESK